MICEICIILHISKLKCPIKFRQSFRIFQSEFLNFSNEAGLLCLFFQHQILSKICPSWWNVLGISSICVWNMLRCSFSNFPPKKRAYVLKRAHALKTIQKISENHEHRRPEKQVTTTHLLNCKKIRNYYYIDMVDWNQYESHVCVCVCVCVCVWWSFPTFNLLKDFSKR